MRTIDHRGKFDVAGIDEILRRIAVGDSTHIDYWLDERNRVTQEEAQGKASHQGIPHAVTTRAPKVKGVNSPPQCSAVGAQGANNPTAQAMKRTKLEWAIVALIIWVLITGTIDRLRHPELTETQLLLRLPRALFLR